MFSNDQLDIESLPKLEDINMKPIHQRYLYVLVINILIVYSSVVTALVVLRIIAEDEGFKVFSNYFMIIIAILAVLSILIYYLGFKKRAYAMRERDIIYRQGYLVTKTLTLPYNRIQHIEITRSFIARKLKLSTLKIYSAGESGGDMAIKGLPEEVAETQYAFLTKVINDRV